jgi:hypothetical protein
VIHKLIWIYDLISEVIPRPKCDTNTAMILEGDRDMNYGKEGSQLDATVTVYW